MSLYKDYERLSKIMDTTKFLWLGKGWTLENSIKMNGENKYKNKNCYYKEDRFITFMHKYQLNKIAKENNYVIYFNCLKLFALE